MGHFLRAFIGKTTTIDILDNMYESSKAIDLKQGYSMYPMTEGLYDEINQMIISKEIDKFEFLTENIEIKVLNDIGNLQLAYVESEFFGGVGGHIGIIWKEQKRIFEGDFKFATMNEILSRIGVSKENSHDEFLTLKLDRHRETEDWINDKNLSQ